MIDFLRSSAALLSQLSSSDLNIPPESVQISGPAHQTPRFRIQLNSSITLPSPSSTMSSNRESLKALEIIPKDLRSARACLVCSLIKSFEQFEFDGCENCDEFLRMKNNRDNIYDCTSSKFEGMIALMSPEDSWVAKWQRINRFTKGVYAISVAGRLPPGVVREMKNRGINYRSRDMSTR